MSANIIVEQIEWGSQAYKEGLELRDLVLRKPLRLSIWDDPWEQEGQDIHVRAICEQKTIGILLLRPLHEQQLQMKQVAVDENMRGFGIGAALVRQAEQIAKRAGYHTIKLHAREVAVPFYQKLHYTIEGEPFMEVGITHYLMKKELNGSEQI